MPLDAFGQRLWSLCDGRTRVADMVPTLMRERGLALQHCRVDTVVQLHRWQAQGLVDAPGLLDLGSGERRKFDLRDVRFYVINCARDDKRRAYMSAQLERLGLDYELVPGIASNPARLGIALSHLKILAREELRVPFAILEDDCEFTDDLALDLEVPAETDALYLGVSHFGSRVPGELSRARWRAVRWVRLDTGALRVFNMLSRHAILYLSEAFRSRAGRASVLAMTRTGPERQVPADLAYAMLHATHLVVTPRRPMCRQTAALGGSQKATEHPLDHVWPEPLPPESRLGV